MLKKLLTLCLCILMTGCTVSSSSAVPSSSSAETVLLSDEYEQLPEENAYYIGEKENIKNYIEHGTGILVLGFPACPWCQAYLPLFNEVLEETGAQAMYYNIRVDKTEDREFYDEVASLIEEVNDSGEEIILYDNDGRQVIYMPLVLFISSGRIIAFDNETSMESSEEHSPEEYWTEEKVSSLKERLSEYTRVIAEAQAENDAKGCDSGCEVKPQGSN